MQQVHNKHETANTSNQSMAIQQQIQSTENTQHNNKAHQLPKTENTKHGKHTNKAAKQTTANKKHSISNEHSEHNKCTKQQIDQHTLPSFLSG